MNKVVIDAKRIETMKSRLGKASELVDSDNYLPMFRNRQIHFKDEFEESVRQAQKKKNPSAWFAHIWSRENMKKTVEMMKKYLARKVADIAHARELKRRKDYEKKVMQAREVASRSEESRAYSLKVQEMLARFGQRVTV